MKAGVYLSCHKGEYEKTGDRSTAPGRPSQHGPGTGNTVIAAALPGFG